MILITWLGLELFLMRSYRWTCLTWGLSTILLPVLLILIKLVVRSTLINGLGNLRWLVLVKHTLTWCNIRLGIVWVLGCITRTEIGLSLSTNYAHSRTYCWLSIVRKFIVWWLWILNIMFFKTSFSLWKCPLLYILKCIIIESLMMLISIRSYFAGIDVW